MKNNCQNMKPYVIFQRKTLIITNILILMEKPKKAKRITLKQKFDNLYHNIVEVQQTVFLRAIEDKIKATFPNMTFLKIIDREVAKCEIVKLGYKYFYGFVWEMVTKPDKSLILTLEEKLKGFTFCNENVKVYVKENDSTQRTIIGGAFLNELLEGVNVFASLEDAEKALEEMELARAEKIRLISENTLPVGYDFVGNGYEVAYMNVEVERCNTAINECQSKGHPYLQMKKEGATEHIVYCPTCKHAFSCDSSD